METNSAIKSATYSFTNSATNSIANSTTNLATNSAIDSTTKYFKTPEPSARFRACFSFLHVLGFLPEIKIPLVVWPVQEIDPLISLKTCLINPN